MLTLKVISLLVEELSSECWNFMIKDNHMWHWKQVNVTGKRHSHLNIVDMMYQIVHFERESSNGVFWRRAHEVNMEHEH